LRDDGRRFMEREGRGYLFENIDAVIFDMDGVVTSSARAHAAAWKKMFDEYLKERSRRTQERYVPFDDHRDYLRYIDGKPRYEGVQSFLESRGISLDFGNTDDPPGKETVCGLGNLKNQYFRKHLQEYGAEPYQSTVDFVRFLKGRGIRVAVISASRNARAVMEAAGVQGLFEEAVDGVDSARLGLRGKPAPDIFLEAARRLKVSPDRTAIVEDALAGVKAGKEGSFALVIGIDRGGQGEEMKKEGADIVVTDLSDLHRETEMGGSRSAGLPSALAESGEIIRTLLKGDPAVFLDYDGTLTPIVQKPAQAVLSERVRQVIKRLVRHWPVAVISGRALQDVREKVGLDSVIYAGSHGFSIQRPGTASEDRMWQRFLPVFDKVYADLEKALQGFAGVHLEFKPYDIALHYRGADERDVPQIERRFDEVAGKYPELKKTAGKKIFELRPNVDWDKGRAVLHLVEGLQGPGRRVVPLYIGDDVTDEDAFRSVAKRGIGILVSDEDRLTRARYTLNDPEETARFLEVLAETAERENPRDVWTLVYQGFDPSREMLREALCTTGNGYFATRGAAPESAADEIHYPGTYVAGLYNRLQSTVAGRTIENESMVNVPNWLELTFCIDDGDWFDLGSVELLEYRQELDMRRGVLSRIVRFKDGQGRHTRLTQRRFVHIRLPHLAGLETVIVPEDFSGLVRVRSAIDGRVENSLVKRYRQLNNRHLIPLENGVSEDGIIWLEVQTNRSNIRIAEAVRNRAFLNDCVIHGGARTLAEPGYIGQEFTIGIRAGEAVRIEKTAAIYHSRDRAIFEARAEAVDAVRHAAGFAELLEGHVLGWDHLWNLWGIDIETERRRMAQILNLHIFHLLQTVSPNTTDLDAGVPPRGLHGEAYRGLIMWDELFIFPLLNLRMPEITRSLLRYRYRRLPRAIRSAREEGYEGAMFPWQSGSNGREEAQLLHLNPESGRWIPDNSHLQRHISIAVAYNVWQYYQVTGDIDFMAFYGAEMMFAVARFWASKARYNRSLDRYEICGVMGPDEFHDAYPDAGEPGIHNNAFTNIMVSWLLCRSLEMMDILPADRRKILVEHMSLKREELEHWDEISRKMRLVFHGDRIISQFEGYGELREFDWEGYRRKYGDIHRLDRILEAEGDTPNRYKVSKQADLLMAFYLLSAEELGALFNRLGYPFDRETIPRNIQYYLKRTAHGSTLSRVVHSWVLSRSRRDTSWDLFQEALKSDISDIQGGTTHEGIHLGAMAGTVDIIQRSYTGLETSRDILRFNPSLPQGLKSARFTMKYRQHRLTVNITKSLLQIKSEPLDTAPIRIGFREREFELKAGSILEFDLNESGRP